MNLAKPAVFDHAQQFSRGPVKDVRPDYDDSRKRREDQQQWSEQHSAARPRQADHGSRDES